MSATLVGLILKGLWFMDGSKAKRGRLEPIVGGRKSEYALPRPAGELLPESTGVT